MSSLITNVLRRNRIDSGVVVKCTRTLSSIAPPVPTSTITSQISTILTPNYPELVAKIRGTDSSGSRKSRYLRDEGIIPGVLSGLDDERTVMKRMVSVELKTIAKELRERKNSMENTIYRLRLDDNTTHLVTPRQLQVHPCKFSTTIHYYPTLPNIPSSLLVPPVLDIPIAVNFLKYRPGNRMRIPVDFVNADMSVDLRRGCFLTRINRFVECICENDVPTKLVVDLSGVQKGDVVRLSALTLPAGVRPSPTVPSDYVIAVIKSFKASK